MPEAPERFRLALTDSDGGAMPLSREHPFPARLVESSGFQEDARSAAELTLRTLLAREGASGEGRRHRLVLSGDAGRTVPLLRDRRIPERLIESHEFLERLLCELYAALLRLLAENATYGG